MIYLHISQSSRNLKIEQAQKAIWPLPCRDGATFIEMFSDSFRLITLYSQYSEMEFAFITKSANGMRPFLVSTMEDMRTRVKTLLLGKGCNYFHSLANERERR